MAQARRPDKQSAVIYLIGGVGRAGKSTLATKLIEAKPMPCVPTDALVSMLKAGAPKLGMKHGSPRSANKFEKFFYGLTGTLNHAWTDAVIEGDFVLPRFTTQLRKQEIDFVACFIGLSKVTHRQLIDFEGSNKWYSLENTEGRREARRFIIERSRTIENACYDLDLPYFDMSAGDYKRQQKRVLRYLLGEN